MLDNFYAAVNEVRKSGKLERQNCFNFAFIHIKTNQILETF